MPAPVAVAVAVVHAHDKAAFDIGIQDDFDCGVDARSGHRDLVVGREQDGFVFIETLLPYDAGGQVVGNAERAFLKHRDIVPCGIGLGNGNRHRRTRTGDIGVGKREEFGIVGLDFGIGIAAVPVGNVARDDRNAVHIDRNLDFVDLAAHEKIVVGHRPCIGASQQRRLHREDAAPLRGVGGRQNDRLVADALGDGARRHGTGNARIADPAAVQGEEALVVDAVDGDDNPGKVVGRDASALLDGDFDLRQHVFESELHVGRSGRDPGRIVAPQQVDRRGIGLVAQDDGIEVAVDLARIAAQAALLVRVIGDEIESAAAGNDDFRIRGRQPSVGFAGIAHVVRRARIAAEHIDADGIAVGPSVAGGTGVRGDFGREVRLDAGRSPALFVIVVAAAGGRKRGSGQKRIKRRMDGTCIFHGDYLFKA